MYCQIKSADTTSYQYHYFAAEVIVYHRQLMLSTAGGGIIEDNRAVSYTATATEDFGITNYTSSLVMMGTKEISNGKQNTADGLSFTIDITTHPINITQLGPQYSIWAFFLYF